MSLIVKKPSDDPHTWLGPEYTIYNFQEDITATPEWKNHGLTQSANFNSSTVTTGNGFFRMSLHGDATNHDMKYIYKDLTETSTIVASFDTGGPASSNDLANREDSTWMGIV